MSDFCLYLYLSSYLRGRSKSRSRHVSAVIECGGVNVEPVSTVNTQLQLIRLDVAEGTYGRIFCPKSEIFRDTVDVIQSSERPDETCGYPERSRCSAET